MLVWCTGRVQRRRVIGDRGAEAPPLLEAFSKFLISKIGADVSVATQPHHYLRPRDAAVVCCSVLS